jgi:hypothetical protein
MERDARLNPPGTRNHMTATKKTLEKSCTALLPEFLSLNERLAAGKALRETLLRERTLSP